MADNFLEKQYEDYLAAKRKAEKLRTQKWRKQLEAYKKKIQKDIK